MSGNRVICIVVPSLIFRVSMAMLPKGKVGSKQQKCEPQKKLLKQQQRCFVKSLKDFEKWWCFDPNRPWKMSNFFRSSCHPLQTPNSLKLAKTCDVEAMGDLFTNYSIVWEWKKPRNMIISLALQKKTLQIYLYPMAIVYRIDYDDLRNINMQIHVLERRTDTISNSIKTKKHSPCHPMVQWWLFHRKLGLTRVTRPGHRRFQGNDNSNQKKTHWVISKQ